MSHDEPLYEEPTNAWGLLRPGDEFIFTDASPDDRRRYMVVYVAQHWDQTVSVCFRDWTHLKRQLARINPATPELYRSIRLRPRLTKTEPTTIHLKP